jgi:linoleoyl-CoA desaturase
MFRICYSERRSIYLEEDRMSSLRPALQFARPGAFAREVAARGRQAIEKSGKNRFATAADWLRAGACAGFALIAYGCLLAAVGGPVAATGWIGLAGFGAFLMAAQLGHDAAHAALSPRRAVNEAVLFAVFAIIGVDGRLWRDRHIRLHHSFANLPGTGIDADSIDFMRLAPDKPRHWYTRFQPLYGPVFFAVGHLSLAWIEDMVMLCAARHAQPRDFATPVATAAFVGGKLVHAVLFLALPALALRPSVLALGLGYLLASSIVAFCFVILVIGTHVSDLARFPQPDAQGRLPHDWATHQLVTSVDWAPTNRLAVLVTGGANAHAAHHLFPGHHHRHLALLSRIVTETAAAHGVPHCVTSFSGMLRGQWRQLVLLSRS